MKPPGFSNLRLKEFSGAGPLSWKRDFAHPAPWAKRVREAPEPIAEPQGTRGRGRGRRKLKTEVAQSAENASTFPAADSAPEAQRPNERAIRAQTDARAWAAPQRGQGTQGRADGLGHQAERRGDWSRGAPDQVEARRGPQCARAAGKRTQTCARGSRGTHGCGGIALKSGDCALEGREQTGRFSARKSILQVPGPQRFRRRFEVTGCPVPRAGN